MKSNGTEQLYQFPGQQSMKKNFLGLERFENIKSSSLLKQIVQNSKEKKKGVSSQIQKRVLERIMDHIKILYS